MHKLILKAANQCRANGRICTRGGGIKQHGRARCGSRGGEQINLDIGDQMTRFARWPRLKRGSDSTTPDNRLATGRAHKARLLRKQGRYARPIGLIIQQTKSCNEFGNVMFGKQTIYKQTI
jgi:hypothetical protein